MKTPLLALAALTLAPACRPAAGKCAAQDKPLPVQLLATAGSRLNPCDDGQPCPAVVQIYELKSGANLEELDFFTVFEQGEKAFGDAFIKVHEREVFPDQHDRWGLELDPKTTHVVTVGQFREPLGDGWYQVFVVPAHHAEMACEAAARGKPIGDPCIYLSFDDYEIAGGRFPPPGFDVRAFPVSCAPVAPPPPRKKKRPPPRPSLSDIPQPPTVPTPKIPSAPQTPTIPSAPKAPAAPSAPSAPTAPNAQPLRPRSTP